MTLEKLFFTQLILSCKLCYLYQIYSIEFDSNKTLLLKLQIFVLISVNIFEMFPKIETMTLDINHLKIFSDL